MPRWLVWSARRPISKAEKITPIYSGLPLQTLFFCPPPLRKQVQALARAERFDLVHVHTARLAPVVSGLHTTPTVLDFIDALSLNMSRRAVRERSPTRWLFQLESRRMARYERELLRSFDRQIVSSQLDKESIAACESLHVIPNGVDIARWFPQDGPDRRA